MYIDIYTIYSISKFYVKNEQFSNIGMFQINIAL